MAAEPKPETCPKCGSRRVLIAPAITGQPVEYWACGSDTDGDFNQSDECRIAELTSQLAAERDEGERLEGFRDFFLNDIYEFGLCQIAAGQHSIEVMAAVWKRIVQLQLKLAAENAPSPEPESTA